MRISTVFSMIALIMTLGILSKEPCLAIQKTDTEKKVEIIQIVEHPALDVTRQGILDELKNSKVRIDYQSAQGNPALAAQIAQKFVSASPNVLVGIGTMATQVLIAANQQHLHPIIFSSVTDPKGAKFIQTLNAPEGMVTGVSNFVDPGLQFDFFKKILPELQTIGIIYNPGEVNSVTLVEDMRKIASKKGLRLMLATANNSADIAQATHKLVSSVQAIFINNDNTALSAFESIVNISNKYNIPVFCSDVDMIQQGALATLGADQYEIGRQTGKIILKILQGERPQNIPVAFPSKTEIRINKVQANKLGINIPKSLLESLSD